MDSERWIGFGPIEGIVGISVFLRDTVGRDGVTRRSNATQWFGLGLLYF